MPHRITTIKRYRISNDVLILILEKLNPVALYRTCQAFDRVWNLVNDFQHLRYKFDLAVVGMKDGPAPYSGRSTMMRLQLLVAYKKDWPRLKWPECNEQKVRVPAAATQVNVSGAFLYYVANQTLDLIELPSLRTGRLPSQTRHIKYNTSPDADCVAIDPLQSLIVTSHIYEVNGQVGLRLKIRNLWTFEKHPRASSAYYDCSTHVTQQIDNVSISVCGTRMVSTLEFVGGMTKHLLMDWSTLQAMWLEEQDVVLLNPYFLLGVRKVHGKMALYLYNISDMRKVAIEREYELPPIWANSTMRFGRNTAPNTDVATPSTALFYSDPSARVLLLSAKQMGTNATGMHWMLINESFFRPTAHDDRRMVPWAYWSQFCLIRELHSTLVVGSPQVVGSRVVYLEKDGSRSPSGQERTRLKIIDFSLTAEAAVVSPKAWTLLGKHSTIKPSEYQRDLSYSTTNGLAVGSICATEDNIVLLLENHGDFKPVNIITFGPPPPQKMPRQDVQYHPSL